MEKNYLIINLGSSSKRYALFINDVESIHAHFKKQHNDFIVTIQNSLGIKTITIPKRSFVHSLSYFLGLLKNQESVKIGIRVVAPGIYFTQNRLVDAKYQKELKKAQKIAPLHIELLLSEIEQCKKLLPNIPLIGISDSAFHTTIPQYAKVYALPLQVTEKYDIYRFGYHGISMQSVMRKINHLLGRIPSNIIVCHLGSGSSITAIKNGKSIDTSMGFTPLQGIPMGTRIGDIDPGILPYLAQKMELSFEQLNNYLNTKCGMLGISGETSDMQKLLELAETGNLPAKLALEVYSYSIKKYIGAYCAALGGLDLLVFTGGIGENSPRIRSLVCKDLTFLNISVNPKKNSALIKQDVFIENTGSIKVGIIVTNEMHEIALQLKNF